IEKANWGNVARYSPRPLPWENGLQSVQSLVIEGVMERFFFDVRGETDQEWVSIDGSYIRAHQHASGARHNEDRAIGRSRGGATTKIHMAVDSHGRPIHFEITGGEVHDSQVACQLIESVEKADYLVADKGYDAEAIRETARHHGMIPIIPRRS